MPHAYLEHTAIYVRDIQWYKDFFEKTLHFTERLRKEDNGKLQQIWLKGGLQLIEVEDEMPQGRNWMTLPDGLCLEILQASPGTVQEILNINPWA